MLVSSAADDIQPSVHAEPLWQAICENPDLTQWWGNKPWTCYDDVLEWAEVTARLPSVGSRSLGQG